MRVAVGQVASILDSAANRQLVLETVRRAAPHRPDLVVLPEAAMQDFGRVDRDLRPVAETLDGPFVQTVRVAAASSGAVVVAGMFETRSDGRLPYNTVVAVAPSGELLVRYRKLHLYDAFAYAESDRLTPGSDEPPVFDLLGVRVGVMTCYDLRFPEVARLLIDGGADALVIPAAWVVGEHKVQHWQHLLAARAIENTAYVVGAAQPGPRYAGHSAILDPAGQVLDSADTEPAVIAADLDPLVVESVRAGNPSLENRRFAVVRR